MIADIKNCSIFASRLFLFEKSASSEKLFLNYFTERVAGIKISFIFAAA
jgi:hypothetical protein